MADPTGRQASHGAREPAAASTRGGAGHGRPAIEQQRGMPLAGRRCAALWQLQAPPYGPWLICFHFAPSHHARRLIAIGSA